MTRNTPQVGAPDPARTTSPIFDEEDIDEPTPGVIVAREIELEPGHRAGR